VSSTTPSDISLRSIYVPMRDGVRLAVDVWSAASEGQRSPCLLLTTRYWRSLDLSVESLSRQPMLPLARYFTSRGCVVVNVDSRGSGASFGTRRTEWSDAEVDDIGEIIDWIASQPWSNEMVFAHGYSYGGNTAFFAACSARPALRAVLPQFADFDLFAHNTYPGGIPNAWLHRNWGTLTAALDSNDVAAVAVALPGVDASEFTRLVRGPRPVDGDAGGMMLQQAQIEHRRNFNMRESTGAVVYQDDAATHNAGRDIDLALDSRQLSIYSRQAAIGSSAVPIVYWAGWFDAGTAEGALALFENFSNPMHVIIGPWNHGRRYLQDPFCSPEQPQPLAIEENFSDIFGHIESFMRGDVPVSAQRRLDYYTFGSNRWRTTTQWPPPGIVSTQLYFGGGKQLLTENSEGSGHDSYSIDLTASTGTRNRWHTQIGCPPVVHEERRGEDEKLLTYDSDELPRGLEISGNPVVHLDVSCDRPSVDLFVYLEMISPDGSVRLITEGCLRALHRKLADVPLPYRQFRPEHSFEQRDSSPLRPGAISTLSIGLLPISIEIPAGFRLRIAIAGADCDTFAVPDAAASIDLHWGPRHASRLELPTLAQ
jgi:putative CocE/NonD family hydrolase